MPFKCRGSWIRRHFQTSLAAKLVHVPWKNEASVRILGPVWGTKSGDLATYAFRFVLIIGVANLFADMTYEGARSVTGPFLGSLGASATASVLLRDLAS